MKINGVLHNWKFKGKLKDSDFCIEAEIYGDTKDRFSDGKIVRTSPIQEIDFKNGFVKTKNSIYKLGVEAE